MVQEFQAGHQFLKVDHCRGKHAEYDHHLADFSNSQTLNVLFGQSQISRGSARGFNILPMARPAFAAHRVAAIWSAAWEPGM